MLANTYRSAADTALPMFCLHCTAGSTATGRYGVFRKLALQEQRCTAKCPPRSCFCLAHLQLSAECSPERPVAAPGIFAHLGAVALRVKPVLVQAVRHVAGIASGAVATLQREAEQQRTTGREAEATRSQSKSVAED